MTPLQKDSYQAPAITVVEVKIEGVVCLSPGEYNNPFGDQQDL